MTYLSVNFFDSHAQNCYCFFSSEASVIIQLQSKNSSLKAPIWEAMGFLLKEASRRSILRIIGPTLCSGRSDAKTLGKSPFGCRESESKVKEFFIIIIIF